MKKIKFISNEKLTIIKTKKPQMKTLKRIHANVKEVYQTNDPNKKTAFCSWKKMWRNEIYMNEVSIGSYKEETNLEDDKISNKKTHKNLLWTVLILSMIMLWSENVETIGGIFVNNCWNLKLIKHLDVMHIFLNNRNQYSE